MLSCDRNCECRNKHPTILDAFGEYKIVKSKRGKNDRNGIPKGGSVPTPRKNNIIESRFRCRGGNTMIANYWRDGIPVNALGMPLGFKRALKCPKCPK